MGRINGGGGDDGEPVRSPLGWLRFRRPRSSMGCYVFCRRVEVSEGSARLQPIRVTHMRWLLTPASSEYTSLSG